MSHDHHGRHSFSGKSYLSSTISLRPGTTGRFGRIFHELPPLYIEPLTLENLGKIKGPMDAGSKQDLTKGTPLGMIFLGQFIDHDITFDTATSFNQINQPDTIENTRTARLDLDCIFGSGPEDNPFLYVEEGKDLRLLTGSANQNVAQPDDLARHDLPRNGRGRALIGDPRNDENRIISQLQLAFIRFYNAIYGNLARKNPNKAAFDVYHEARQLSTWHYQWIVVNEFLPLLCGKTVVNDILSNGRSFYKPKEGAFIPVEFSVAAYRFGHSMITQILHLQHEGDRSDLFSSDIGRGFTPISKKEQIVDWSVFFNFNGDFQKAAKLNTKLATTLLKLPFIRSADSADQSLATRNLRRGQSFLLPSGEQVANAMARTKAEIDDVRDHIRLTLSDHNIELGSGTPLWYYILAEAEEIGRSEGNNPLPGEGLGPVGATLVAEVILGLLELDENSYLGSNRDWKPTLASDTGQFTMVDLLRIADSEIDIEPLKSGSSNSYP